MNKKLLLVLLVLILVFPFLAVLVLTFAQGRTQDVSTVKVYMVALQDNGKHGKIIGCNDSVLPVERKISAKSDKMKAALEELLSIKEDFYGKTGLYNYLAKTNLKLDDVTFTFDEKVLVHLSGNYKTQASCDISRLEAQIKETVLQFVPDKEIEIYINGHETKIMTSLLERKKIESSL